LSTSQIAERIIWKAETPFRQNLSSFSKVSEQHCRSPGCQWSPYLLYI
jgi:hypothetical protein